MRKLIINKEYENKDVYNVIKKHFPHLSISSLNKAFRTRDIKVNGIRVNKDYSLKCGDIITIYITDNILFGLPKNILIAYEDDNILVAYKPKGVTSNYEKGIRPANIIYFDEIIKSTYPNAIICHRLDTNTEGLVIFAKNNTAHHEIINGFKNNSIIKEYITLVLGKPNKDKDILKHHILKDAKTGYSKVIKDKINNAKACTTEYKLIKYIKDKNCSILNITLHTGRTHQIRAHMKYIGTPVIGDSKYCSNEVNNKFKLHSQVLFACKYTFCFNVSSPLYYLNTITIDITNTAVDKTLNLIETKNKTL